MTNAVCRSLWMNLLLLSLSHSCYLIFLCFPSYLRVPWNLLWNFFEPWLQGSFFQRRFGLLLWVPGATFNFQAGVFKTSWVVWIQAQTHMCNPAEDYTCSGLCSMAALRQTSFLAVFFFGVNSFAVYHSINVVSLGFSTFYKAYPFRLWAWGRLSILARFSPFAVPSGESSHSLGLSWEPIPRLSFFSGFQLLFYFCHRSLLYCLASSSVICKCVHFKCCSGLWMSSGGEVFKV